MVLDLPGTGRIGLAICYDAWFPEVARHLAWMGAEVIVNPVMTTTADRAQETVLARANAIVNQVHVVSVNTAGPVGRGHSLVVDPEGRVRAEAAGDGSTVLTDVIDLDEVTRVRSHGTAGVTRVWDHFADDDAPIELPLYAGRIDPRTWRPRHRPSGPPATDALPPRTDAPGAPMSHGTDAAPTLTRALGLRAVVLFGLAYMTPLIVLGTFGVVAATTGGTVPTAYLLALAAMLFTAHSYGRMAATYPVAGSSYTYVRKALDSRLGFLVGWVTLLDYLFLPMVIWLIGSAYLGAQFPGVPSWAWIVGFIALTTGLNIRGIKTAERANDLLMVFQILVIAVFVALSLRHVAGIGGAGALASTEPFLNDSTTWAGISGGAALAAYSFLGFDAVTTLTEETVDPERTMPRAILLIALAGGAVFVAVAYTTQLVHPGARFEDEGSAAFEIARTIGGDLFSAVFLAGLVVAQFASGLAAQASTSRLLFAMGRDGSLPRRVFARVHPAISPGREHPDHGCHRPDRPRPRRGDLHLLHQLRRLRGLHVRQRRRPRHVRPAAARRRPAESADPPRRPGDRCGRRRLPAVQPGRHGPGPRCRLAGPGHRLPRLSHAHVPHTPARSGPRPAAGGAGSRTVRVLSPGRSRGGMRRRGRLGRVVIGTAPLAFLRACCTPPVVSDANAGLDRLPRPVPDRLRAAMGRYHRSLTAARKAHMGKPRGDTKRPPGMADVARAAGVSAQTVSRVLSGHPNVQEKTRVKVLTAVEQLGYRRNNAARVLSSGRSRTIGVVTLQTHYYSRGLVTSGIESAARAAGYTVDVATTASLDTSAIEDALCQLSDQGVEGIVLAVPLIHTSRRIEQLTRSLPTVTVDGSRTPDTEVVAVDQGLAARLATRHLLDLGHDTVWHVTGPEAWLESANRRDAWRATLEAAGRPVPPPLEGDWSPASGHRNGLVLGRIPDVTAVFVASDEMAFGVIKALHELGRRVPEDISVVGVDNIELAAYCRPPLTTVAQPFAEMGALAVTHLLRSIADPDAVPEPESVEPRLVVRASTAPARRPSGARTPDGHASV